MKKLRWGVIGAGGIADRRTIPGMMLAKNAELIAVMDINAEQVEKIRQKYGAKRGYTKEEDLLADPEVDAVYIATPIVLHAKQAKLAADYGKDILIEKPLAAGLDEWKPVKNRDVGTVYLPAGVCIPAPDSVATGGGGGPLSHSRGGGGGGGGNCKSEELADALAAARIGFTQK